MGMQTDGSMATEFDPTTNALLNTVTHMGVSDVELTADQTFIADLMLAVNGSLTMGEDPMHTIRLMDCMYIGLVWHRHMPYEVDGEVKRPTSIGPGDYTHTLTIVSNAMARDHGMSKGQVMVAAAEGGYLARSHMKDVAERNPDDEPLLRDILALTALGMILHRLLPTTNQPPAGHVG